MRRLVYLVAVAAFTAGLATPASAQRFGIGAQIGTLGLGGTVGISASRVGVRASANFMPIEPTANYSDVDYTLKLQSPQWSAMVDLYLVGGLRLSGGLVYSTDDIQVEGDLTTSVDIGGTSYTPTEVGTLTGTISDGKDLAPYLGIGFGGPGRSSVGFFFDLGIAFGSKPGVTLAGENGTLSSDPLFQADLAQEAQDIEDDIDILRYYPVVSVGLTIGF